MSRAAWSCDFCETNNTATNDECRNCGAERVLAGGAVQARTRTVPNTHDTSEEPVFFDSRHAVPPSSPPPPPSPSRVRIGGSRPGSPGTSRPTAPEPAAPRLTPSPRPVPPVHRPPSGDNRLVRRAVLWVLATTAVLLIVTNWDSISDALSEGPGTSTNTDVDANAASTTPCPAAAAKWLPDGGYDAVLEVAYTTPRFTITLCRSADGNLFYDGQVTGEAPSSETHISLPATTTANGYVAHNGGYKYETTGLEVIVTRDNVELSRQPLTRTGP